MNRTVSVSKFGQHFIFSCSFDDEVKMILDRLELKQSKWIWKPNIDDWKNFEEAEHQWFQSGKNTNVSVNDKKVYNRLWSYFYYIAKLQLFSISLILLMRRMVVTTYSFESRYM